MKNLTLRTVRPEDLEKIAEIEFTCFPEAEACKIDTFRDRIATFPESFIVAELDGEIVGFINGAIIDNKVLRDEYYHDASLHNPKGLYQSVFGLDVLPNYRRRGIAAALLKEMGKRSREKGLKGFTLNCKEVKVSYYERCGFKYLGKSTSNHGGENWYDMIIEF